MTVTGQGAGERWCVLRTSGASTLKLAVSLQEAGVAAWTPIETTQRRAPGGRSGKIVGRALMLPTYVFVAERDETEVRVLEVAPTTAHPAFRLWRHAGEIVRVRHTALHALRSFQQASYIASLPSSGRHYVKPRGEPFAAGETVKMRTGALAGLECEVTASNGRTTVLTLALFGRIATDIRIPTSQLRADSVATVLTAA